MTPTIGRIVIYRDLTGVDCAAIVTNVYEQETPGLTEVDLAYFPAGGPQSVGVQRRQADPNHQSEPGRWRWPERV